MPGGPADPRADRLGGPPIPAVRRTLPDDRRTGAPGPRARRPVPLLRLGRTTDADACAVIWSRSIADYERRLNRPVFETDLGPVAGLVRHLAATDPERFWVATRPAPGAPASGAASTDDLLAIEGGERVVAFGAASLRGPLWFLGLLFVMPDEQARGLGAALLARTLPGERLPARGAPLAPAGSASVLATVTDAAQPISNALYARIGLVPRVPAWRLVGRPDRPGALGPLPAGVVGIPFAAQGGIPALDPALDADAVARDLERVDRALLATSKSLDHAWRRAAGRAYLYRAADGSPLGYGYVTPAGTVGPVAVVDAALLAPVVGHLLDAHPPAGASSVAVTGGAPGLFRALLEAGFRLDGFPALVCGSGDPVPHDRYVMGSYALP